MTTISNSPLLQILGQRGPVTLANIAGVNNPVAILDAKVIDLLSVQYRNAKAEALKAGGNVSATHDIFATLDDILKAFTHVRNEYYDRIEIERERTEAEHSLQEASNALQKPQTPQ